MVEDKRPHKAKAHLQSQTDILCLGGYGPNRSQQLSMKHMVYCYPISQNLRDVTMQKMYSFKKMPDGPSLKIQHIISKNAADNILRFGP